MPFFGMSAIRGGAYIPTKSVGTYAPPAGISIKFGCGVIRLDAGWLLNWRIVEVVALFLNLRALNERVHIVNVLIQPSSDILIIFLL